MLKHVVLFKFKSGISEQAIIEAENGLAALPGIIEEIKEFSCGRNIVESARSYDFGLVSTFENVDAMQRYQVHPAHQEAASRIRQISDSVVAVDFEF